MLRKVEMWFKENRVDVAIAALLFVVAAVPRMADLGTFLTADEKNWMGRSYEFIRAIKDWRLNDTLQTTHPGVTTLWLSGAAITGYMFLSHTPFSYEHLAHFAAAAQFPIALANSLAVPVIYLFLRRLFASSVSLSGPRRIAPRAIRAQSQPAAVKEETLTDPAGSASENPESKTLLAQSGGYLLPLLASLFIALNPLLIGYSRVTHVDALLASLMFLAALAIMIYARSDYPRRWLVASAVLSGLAILTKAPAVFLVPFFILVLLVHEPSFWKKADVLRSRVRDFVLWLLIITLMFLIIWPALLFVPDPKGNALILKRDLGAAALTPHHMAEDYSLEADHYLKALLARTTPVSLIFAGMVTLWLLANIPMSKSQIPIKSQFSNNQNRSMWLLVAYIFFFVLMMTLVAKKGDRYIMPVFLALDILAAFGILVIGGLLENWKLKIENLGMWLTHGLEAAAVIYLAATIWNYHPYAIAYSNPLFRDNLSQELGWGEGLEQVAAWLNKNDSQAIVASWYPEELGAYTSAQVAHINAHEQSKVKYVVLYRNMFGRAPDHYANDFIDEYYRKREPMFVAHVVGKEFAWVYSKWTFERVVGELLPGVKIEQEIPVTHENLLGVDVMVATYSGRAKAGEFVVTMQNEVGEVLAEWRTPVEKILDDRWLTLRLPQPRDLRNEQITVRVEAIGTAANNAPTVRYSSDRDYRGSSIAINDEARRGDLAVRLRYGTDNNQEATEEETLLLNK